MRRQLQNYLNNEGAHHLTLVTVLTNSLRGYVRIGADNQELYRQAMNIPGAEEIPEHLWNDIFAEARTDYSKGPERERHTLHSKINRRAGRR